jgi:hypothetical protein
MFEGLTFMVRGRMCCGVSRDELIVRPDPEHESDALARPHANERGSDDDPSAARDADRSSQATGRAS